MCLSVHNLTPARSCILPEKAASRGVFSLKHKKIDKEMKLSSLMVNKSSIPHVGHAVSV